MTLLTDRYTARIAGGVSCDDHIVIMARCPVSVTPRAWPPICAATASTCSTGASATNSCLGTWLTRLLG